MKGNGGLLCFGGSLLLLQSRKGSESVGVLRCVESEREAEKKEKAAAAITMVNQ